MDSTKHTQSTTLLQDDSSESIITLLDYSCHDNDRDYDYDYNFVQGKETENKENCRNYEILSNSSSLSDTLSTPQRHHHHHHHQGHDDGENHNRYDTFMVILIGQLLSIANACTGAASTTLANTCGINSPTAQSVFMYATLSIFLCLLPRKKPHSNYNDTTKTTTTNNNNNNHNKEQTIKQTIKEDITVSKMEESLEMHNNNNNVDIYYYLHLPFTQQHIQLQAPWYYYAILAFLDLEANYLTYFAYRYTSFTSITLFASLAIPSAMFFSRLLLNRRYNMWHFFGVLLCFVGFILTLGSDLGNDDNDDNDIDDNDNDNDNDTLNNNMDTDQITFPHAFRGDVLAICGAIIYGLNDTLTERSVKQFSFVEFLGMLGFFGMIFSIFQIIILERDAFSLLFQLSSSSSSSSSSSACSSYTPILLFVWNTLSLSAYYIGASYFLLHNDAALLDVSLLTSNIYAIIFVVVSENFIPPHPLGYCLSVLLVVFGVFVYEKGSSLFLHGNNADDHSKVNNIKEDI